MRNAGLDEAQTGIKIARRNINNLRYADDTTLMAESEEELKSFLMKVKEEEDRTAWNMYIIKGETDHQPRRDAWDKYLGLVLWEDPEGSGGEGGGRGDRDGEHM